MSKSSKSYTQEAENVIKAQGVDPSVGLSEAQAQARLAHFGHNVLPRGPRTSAFKIFASQFKDVLILVLLASATVSLVLGWLDGESSPTEALLIYGVVLAIAIVGFANEYKAEKTVEALKKLISQTCRVRRDGQIKEIGTESLVPGDIVILDEGKKVPADIRILEENYLQTIEASLTGESMPVPKTSARLSGELALADQKNMLFSSTIIATGTAIGVVIATGAKTEIGAIARMVSSVEEEITPMQEKLNNLGKRIAWIILAICVVTFIAILFFDTQISNQSFADKILFAIIASIALAVAAIPEGLAFVVRISLALGARRMAGKNALVRRLAAVESLGSTDVVCCDKTGTLTKGEMTSRKLYADGKIYEFTGTGYSPEGNLLYQGEKAKPSESATKVVETGALCNNAQLSGDGILGDPTEGCLLVAAEKIGIKIDALAKKFPRISEVPFSSSRKMMSTLHQDSQGFIVMAKGGPAAILGLCSHEVKDGKVVNLTAARKNEIHVLAKNLASEGLRVLAFAYREHKEKPKDSIEHGLVFAGIQAMSDPPRKEVVEVIRRVQTEAGMRVVMITGDSIETAKAVAKELGITGEAITGVELDALSQAEFNKKVKNIGVYGRVNPEHKLRIVQAFQHHGHQVAMTGDGVNDAPAIKAANIGIAMGITGTDAAKEASDMILLDDRFVTIIDAIEEGRGIFDNVRKFVSFLLSCNIAEVITIFLGILVYHNLLLTAAQLLFINIITDGLPAVALGSDPASKNVMRFKPHQYQQEIINRRVWAEIFVFGGLMSVLILAQYGWALNRDGVAVASSVVFAAMVVYEFARLFDIRTDYKAKLFSNKLLLGSVAVSLALQFAVIYLPQLADVFAVVAMPGVELAYIAFGAVVLFGIMKLLNPIFDLISAEK